jgi:hypothetical protein
MPSKLALFRRLVEWFRAIWPWLPLAAVLILIGALNILIGLRYQLILNPIIRVLAVASSPKAIRRM